MVDVDDNPITEEMLNTLGVSHSRPFSGARINLRSDVPEGRASLCAPIDGEEFPASPRVVIEVIPRALRLIIS